MGGASSHPVPTVGAVRGAYTRLVADNSGFEELASALSSSAKWAVVGGAVRDWSIGRAPRDIDIVTEAASSRVRDWALAFKAKRNSFGGWKIDLDGVTVDLWALEDNWAHRQGLAPRGGLETLKHTAFLNIDTGMFLPSTNEAFLGDLSNAFRNRTLSLVLAKNPFPNISAIRSLVCAQRYGLTPSKQVLAAVRHAVRESGSLSLISAQAHHYRAVTVSEEEIESIASRRRDET